jgi:hypothetical protein
LKFVLGSKAFDPLANEGNDTHWFDLFCLAPLGSTLSLQYDFEFFDKTFPVMHDFIK